jgi:hypothetical protein
LINKLYSGVKRRLCVDAEEAYHISTDEIIYTFKKVRLKQLSEKWRLGLGIGGEIGSGISHRDY